MSKFAAVGPRLLRLCLDPGLNAVNVLYISRNATFMSLRIEENFSKTRSVQAISIGLSEVLKSDPQLVLSLLSTAPLCVRILCIPGKIHVNNVYIQT